METPPELTSAVAREISRDHAPLRKQVAALSELFDLFTRRREGLRGRSYMDVPALRNAYLRYHLPLNVARATWVLEQVLAVHPKLEELEFVLDLGAGPASASLATLFTLPRKPVREYLLTDRSRSVLQVGRALLQSCALPEGLHKVHTAVRALLPIPHIPRKALVWLAMVFNEAQTGSRGGRGRRFEPIHVLDALAQRLDSPSVVIVTEPALREPARALLKLHDAAVASGRWRVVAPCTHQLSCPLLRASGRSWCHFHFAWQAPPLVREVADPLRLEHAFPSVALLALERAPSGARADTPRSRAEGGARVIGDVMELADGRWGIYVCRKGRRELLVPAPPGLRRGDRIPANDARTGKSAAPPGLGRK